MANSDHLEILNQGREFWNRWRNDNPDILPDLSQTDFSGKILSETNLPYQDPEFSQSTIQLNLSGSNLSNSRFRNTILRGVNFSRAILRFTDFYRADLRRANLSKADLTGARLNRTNLTLANLRDTNLTEAHVWETIFARVDLSDVRGLETCIQPGPSIIDERTFRESRSIPIKFLRGCGLSEWQIEAAKLNQRKLNRSEIIKICYEIIRLRTDPALQYYSCFISYSHEDKEFARSLNNVLQESGIRCWLDEHQILPGDDIFEQIDRGIQLWDKVILCCSEASLKSWWVDNEIMTAFSKEQKLMKERSRKVLTLIPLDLDRYIFSDKWNRGFKQQLQSRLVADFTAWKSGTQLPQKPLEKLILALRADEEAREVPPVSLL
jgi:uncharacterized protein YjbI with pentapeptide repeats